MTFGIWRSFVIGVIGTTVTEHLKYRHHWLFCVAALAGWLTVGWAALEGVQIPQWMHQQPLPSFWIIPFVFFGLLVGLIVAVKLPTKMQWVLLALQVVAVAAMVAVVPTPVFSVLLVIIAWQVATTSAPFNALLWVAAQTLVIVAAVAQVRPGFEVCFIFGLSLALQLFFVFTAHALRLEAETSRALAQSNSELRAAQAIIANAVRDAERLRISRELHDAWGHELTALGLQLEIASHILAPGAPHTHVLQAKVLAKALLAKVRDIVATLREADSCDLRGALEALAQSVPVPVVHLEIALDVRVTPDQAHTLMRCAQEALTNAVKHAGAGNLWLKVCNEDDGVRLSAFDDGPVPAAHFLFGAGLTGMRERLEHLGGQLVVQAQADPGFKIDAWLPARHPRAA